jgi:hypothetical protein
MKERIELRIEKELYEELFDNFRKLEDKVKEQESKINEPNLEFKQVAKNAYRVYNPKTGRFHNPELGIDEVV